MKALEISSIKGSFAAAIRELRSEPVVLTDGDTPIAVLYLDKRHYKVL